MSKYHPVGSTVKIKPRDKMPDAWQVDEDHDDYIMYEEIYEDFANQVFVVEIIQDWQDKDVPACVRRSASGNQLGWQDALVDEWDLTLVYEDVEMGVQ